MAIYRVELHLVSCAQHLPGRVGTVTASASEVLRLEACTTTPDYLLIILQLCHIHYYDLKKWAFATVKRKGHISEFS